VNTPDIKSFLRLTAEMMDKHNMGSLRGYKHRSMYHLVLAEGHGFKTEALTPDEELTLKPILEVMGRRKPELRMCYMNAYNMADLARTMHVDMFYAEGFAAGIIPVTHAWNVFRGKVLDLTWRPRGIKGYVNDDSVQGLINRINSNIVDNSYHGFEFPMVYMTALIYKHEAYVSGIDDWEGRWPLCKYGLELFKDKVRRGRRFKKEVLVGKV